MYYVFARRYSKNGNKTYSYSGFMNGEELKNLFDKIHSQPNKEWYISVQTFNED